MLYREWPLLQRRVSAIALGTAHFGAKMPEETAFSVMDAYYAMGGNVLDTARIYGDFDKGIQGISEKTIGKWIAQRKLRSEIIISTKGAHPPWLDRFVSRLDRASIESDMEESLEALGVDGVEMYYLHRDDENRPVGDILETLNGLVESGRTKLLGASNWKAARIAEANRYAAEHGLHGFSLNQPQWSLALQHHMEDKTLVSMDREMYALHQKTGLVAMPYSSQARGFFTKLFELGEDRLPEDLRRDFMCPENMKRYEAILEVRKETGLSVGAIALAYLTGQPDFITLPIVGVSSLRQVEALKEAVDAALKPETVRELVRIAGLA
jgi:aryl-alcohol dehydrogenase-like predicted oxidoreductase